MNAVSEEFIRPFTEPYAGWLYGGSGWWTLLGFLANILFGSRFVLQWLLSERHGTVVVPDAFWHLSFWGSVLNVLYALHLDNAPLLLGVIALPFIYGRNLVLLRRAKLQKATLQGRIFERAGSRRYATA